ncbi:HAMP domain-containing sensor histidine kinase [Clostridium intestinale]|uniref:sensor histidine kinase n=1 Tax=Clostridium intestinale TaxID=36845 RepID=UPI002DD62702|nr:HAMP domain-containing sensor histidine kinase [Clostridium intestinale]WRY50422.1 HAMP domain-containing sensor histidine kinase [Clostridium intestinale]
MRFRKGKIHNIFGVLLGLIVLSAFIMLAFFITSFIYKTIGKTPNILITQMINSLLGIFFLVTTIFSTINFGSKNYREYQINMFKSIVEAMEQMSKGDFNVKLEYDHDKIKPFVALVKGVNSMALELSTMEKMRQEFVSNVSHEIQSPLTSIKGFAQVLRNNNLSEDERVHYLNIIETESTRLSKLGDNLLKLATLDSDQVELQLKSYRLDKQIRSTILSLEPHWERKNIKFEIFMDEVEIIGDEGMLNQVWTNLIHNSIKFTEENGQIKIYLSKLQDKVEFKIIDTGIGIDEEEQLHIFERFYKADKARARSIGGNGLGLSIVKRIIEVHKGSIEVQSELGNGSTFTIYLSSKFIK